MAHTTELLPAKNLKMTVQGQLSKSYCFSKDWDVHRAATCLTMYSYNFCWAARTLRPPDGRKVPCSLGMAAGLAKHVWTIREWLIVPACQ